MHVKKPGMVVDAYSLVMGGKDTRISGIHWLTNLFIDLYWAQGRTSLKNKQTKQMSLID